MSIFDNKSLEDIELDISNGLTKSYYREIQTDREATGTNFPGNEIGFRWHLKSNSWWVPEQSFVMIEGTLTKGDGTTQLTSADSVAPAMGFVSNLFNRMRLSINDIDVSKIDEHAPQINALKKRIMKSKNWLDNVGKINYWDASFDNRWRIFTTTGYEQGEYEVFQYNDLIDYTVTPNTTFLGPNTTAISAAGVLTIEDGVGDVAMPTPGANDTLFLVGDEIEIDVGGNVGSLRFEITKIITDTGASKTFQLGTFVAKASGTTTDQPWRIYRKKLTKQITTFQALMTPALGIFDLGYAFPSAKYELKLTSDSSSNYKNRIVESPSSKTAGTDFQFAVSNMKFYVKRVDGMRVGNALKRYHYHEFNCIKKNVSSSDSSQQVQFNISRDADMIYVAFQDQSAGSNTRFSISKFKIRSDKDLDVDRLTVDYSGEKQPYNDPDIGLGTGNVKDFKMQRYYENYLTNNNVSDKFSPESDTDYYERGPFYSFHYPKDGSDRSDTVTVTFKFRVAPGDSIPALLVFSRVNRILEMAYTNSESPTIKIRDI